MLTNALILDHWGIVKADIGLKEGRIAVPGGRGLGVLPAMDEIARYRVTI